MLSAVQGRENYVFAQKKNPEQDPDKKAAKVTGVLNSQWMCDVFHGVLSLPL